MIPWEDNKNLPNVFSSSLLNVETVLNSIIRRSNQLLLNQSVVSFPEHFEMLQGHNVF